MGTTNVDVILEIITAVEQRDEARFNQLCSPDLELHWPLSLPYGGVTHGLGHRTAGWEEIWSPHQPTPAERRMDPRVVAAGDEEVVVLWHQRGVGPGGERLDQPVLGLYRLQGGKLVRGQMFYFDTTAVAQFLARAAAAAV